MRIAVPAAKTASAPDISAICKINLLKICAYAVLMPQIFCSGRAAFSAILHYLRFGISDFMDTP